MLLEEQTAGRKQIHSSWASYGVCVTWFLIPERAHRAPLHSGTPACCAVGKYYHHCAIWRNIESFSLHWVYSQQVKHLRPENPALPGTLTEVYNYHCALWGKGNSTKTKLKKLTKDYCISQKRVNNQTPGIKTSKTTKLNVETNFSKKHKWISLNLCVPTNVIINLLTVKWKPLKRGKLIVAHKRVACGI